MVGCVQVLVGPDHPTLAAEVYGRAKVFVQPSLVEGFGYTPVEAMACGAALVTTDNGGSADYGYHERTALVVPPGDPDALAAAVSRLLDDDELRISLAEAGRAHVARFRWERTGAILPNVIVTGFGTQGGLIEVQTDAEGQAWARHLPPGRYKLQAKSPDGRRARR